MSKWVRGYDGERHNLDLSAHLRTVPTKELASDGNVAYTHSHAAVAIYYVGGVQLEAVLFIGEERECDSYSRDLVGISMRQNMPGNAGIRTLYTNPLDQAEADADPPVCGSCNMVQVVPNSHLESCPNRAEECGACGAIGSHVIGCSEQRLTQFERTANGEKLG